MLRYSPTPVQEIHDAVFDKAGVRVLVKREDLNHPYVSGNKWWKLKYNFEEARRSGKKTLLTFGGAYSNHIYSTAAAAHELGFESIGIIRGEETLPLNPTLTFAKSQGMQLHYVSRETYRKKEKDQFIEQLHDRFGDFYLIPEGGTNELAVKGVVEFAQTLGNDFDYLCCAVGTGGTLAGLVRGVSKQKFILGVPVLKGAEFLMDTVRSYAGSENANWALNFNHHFGGYAKSNPALDALIKKCYKENNLPLDPVYTAKLAAGVFDLARGGYFKRGSVILLIHTGGLQVNAVI
ncbi:MAG: pyridoxal-phosphate dependent enzyme [Cyclobacteriaceae bacterium]|nr:pyridoxal-phosphate dependent enzyme [Cyclobacteriaceae bacterium]